jgi:hypothetical protein
MQLLQKIQIILIVVMLLFAVLSLVFHDNWFETYLQTIAGVSLILLIYVIWKQSK